MSDERVHAVAVRLDDAENHDTSLPPLARGHVCAREEGHVEQPFAVQVPSNAVSWLSPAARFATWHASTLVIPFAQALTTSGKPEYLTRLLAVLALTLVWGASWLAVLLCMPTRIADLVMLLGGLLMSTFAAVSGYHLVVYNQLPGVSSIFAIVDTNLTEAAEYLLLTSRPLAWAVGLSTGVVVVLLGLWCRRSLAGKRVTRGDAWWILASGALLVAVPVAAASRAKFALNNPFMFAAHSGVEILAYRSEMKNVGPDTPLHVKSYVAETNLPAAHLLIVGESLSASHMATYGYVRPTTPEIDKHRAFDRIVVRDACSSRCSTILSLRDVMTAVGRYATEPSMRRPNLISTVQRSSYKTYWISNQSKYGTGDSLSSIWSMFADVREFTNLRGTYEGYSYDEVLLPRVEAALADPEKRKVVIVHMMGSHPDYAMRYPPSFERWKPQESVPDGVPRAKEAAFRRAPFNQYDNSVVYSDHLLGRLLDMAQKYDVATVTLFSDHGQNLGEHSAHLGHSLEDGPRQGYEVPVIFWLGESARIDPEKRARLSQHATLPFQTDQLFPTLLDLYGIATEDEALTNSLLRDAYKPVPRVCDKMK